MTVEKNGFNLRNLSFNDDEEYIRYVNACSELDELGLIEFFKNTTVRLTVKGQRVSNNEGLEKFFISHKKIEDRKMQKEVIDFRLSKLKLLTFWPIFIFGLFGGIYSAYDFIERLTTKGDFQQVQIPTTKKELEQSKLHILLLNQKNLDSLNNSNLPSDSLKIN